MSNCNENKQCNILPRENVMINKWQAGVQHQLGCYEYCGFYWINIKDKNDDRPDIGVGLGSYKGAFTLCSLIQYFAELAAKKEVALHEANIKHCKTCPEDNTCNKPCSCPEGETCESCEDDCEDYIDELLTKYKYLIDYFLSVKEWDENTEYNCDDFVIFEGKLIQSRISENTQHPHNRKAWTEHGTLIDILKHTFSDDNGFSLSVPYWKECNKPNCKLVANKGSCYAVRVKKLDKHGKPLVDDCNETIYESKIFISLVDCNPDSPIIGASKNPQTWEGGMDLCEYLNRPIGYDLNNNPIYAIDKKTIITTDDILAPLVIKTINGKKYLTVQ